MDNNIDPVSDLACSQGLKKDDAKSSRVTSSYKLAERPHRSADVSQVTRVSLGEARHSSS
jgi:hypothetical protein